MFADDSLIFLEANADQATRYKEILSSFQKGTGQLLNPSKCSILLGNNVNQENGEATIDILRVEK